MSHWFNYEASLKILIFGLLLGSGLPALFAIAVRVGSSGAGVQVSVGGGQPGVAQVVAPGGDDLGQAVVLVRVARVHGDEGFYPAMARAV